MSAVHGDTMTDSYPTLDLPTPFPGEAGVIRLLEPADADGARLSARVLNGTYDKPFVAEHGDTRRLFFSWTYVQSRMRIGTPTTLEMAYTRAMMGFLLFQTNPRAVLMLGLGGGSLAKYCLHHLPLARIVVIESNPYVLAFRGEFAVPPNDRRFQVIEGDGVAFVAGCRDRYDVMLIDAYDRQGVLPSLCRREFYEDARARLLPGGVLVANLAGTSAERAVHREVVESVFGDGTLVLPVEADDDVVVFAFQEPAFEPRWRWMESQAEAMRRRYGLEFPQFAKRLKEESRVCV
jgi:spermidine synthase